MTRCKVLNGGARERPTEIIWKYWRNALSISLAAMVAMVAEISATGEVGCRYGPAHHLQSVNRGPVNELVIRHFIAGALDPSKSAAGTNLDQHCELNFSVPLRGSPNCSNQVLVSGVPRVSSVIVHMD